MAGKPAKPPSYDAALVRGAAATRWPEILANVGGIPADSLDGNHHPCPKCGGTDRFRLFDEAAGAVICNQCFRTRNGDGFAALQWMLDLDFPWSLAKAGEYLGVPPATKGKKSKGKKEHAEDPAVALEPEPWTDGSRRLLATWCNVHKPGTSPEAVLAAGGFLARYPCYVNPKTGERVIGYHRVIALPIHGAPSWTSAPIVGAQVYRLDGGMLEKHRGPDQPPELLRIKTVGSATGLIGLNQLASIHPSDAQRVWKVEGCSDLLALLTIIIADAGDRPITDVVLTNAGGSNQNVGEMIGPFAELATPTYVLHDADQPGETGAIKWAGAIAAVTETRHVRLPYEVSADHGMDLRDWISEPHTYRDLIEIADAAPVVEAAPASEEPTDEATNDKPATTITNATTEYDAEDRPYVVPMPMSEILARIFSVADNWPRRVGSNLFIHDEPTGVHWLEGPAPTFGWLQSKTGVVEWHRKIGCATKEEVFHSFRREAKPYDAVEFLPHQPPLPNHYYACATPPDGDGEAITSLVERFSPDTDADKWLILALFATTFWGGSGGSRPAFVVTSDAGRGAGKSKLTDMVSYLAGGHIELSQNEDAGIMRQRLLSPEGMNKRIARLDNVKTHKFSWSDLESLITAPVISGKRMYAGEGTRPNNLTWLITLNGPSMSTDMAQRSVIIKLKQPRRESAWEADTMAFIDANRTAIIADLMAFLKVEPEPMPTKTRWATWEGNVLSRLEDPFTAQAIVASRSLAVDTEAEEIDLIERYFMKQIEKYGYDATCDKVMIYSEIAAIWYCDLTKDRKHPTTVGKIINQFIDEGRGGCLHRSTNNKNGRGIVWVGKDAPLNKVIYYDIETRIEAKKEEELERRTRRW